MPQAARTERRRGQSTAGRKDDVIQIRVSAQTKAILNRAAALRGAAPFTAPRVPAVEQ